MSKEPEWSSPTDKINQNGIYTMDGLHPSKVGYRKIVQLINGQIDIVVKD
jgi:lysophospholipase L1-like esterase